MEFAFILKLLLKKYEDTSKYETSKSKQDDDNNSIFESVIPTTGSALRNIYMIGHSSILKDLPRPKVCMVDDHSYISMHQCIVYFFVNSKML